MTLNKIGSDFKKLNFYWLFEKVKLHFPPSSLSRSPPLVCRNGMFYILHM